MWLDFASATTMAVAATAVVVAVTVTVVLGLGIASLFMPRARQRHALEVLDRFVALILAVRGVRRD